MLSEVWLGVVNLKNVKHLKKISKELIPVAWDPRRWWNFCMIGDDKSKIEPIFTE